MTEDAEPVTEDAEFDGCDCKIGRGADRYGLTDLDAVLVERHREGESLRALAHYVNRRVLRAGLEQGDSDLLNEGEQLFGALDDDQAVEALRTALTGEEASAERQARVRTRLKQAGVPIDRVEDDWVSHPTVRTHLRECLGVETSSKADLSSEEGLGTIEWAIAQCTGVVGQTLNRLRSAERLAITDPEIAVLIRITCAGCGATYTPTELISEGRCDCAEGT